MPMYYVLRKINLNMKFITEKYRKHMGTLNTRLGESIQSQVEQSVCTTLHRKIDGIDYQFDMYLGICRSILWENKSGHLSKHFLTF
jgi:hypothetical protein